MKLNKRIKSSLIQTFLFNVVLLVVVVGFWIFVLWPSFQEIQEKKATLSNQYNRLVSTQSWGIEFADFKALAASSDASAYLKEVIKTTSKDFYNRNFKNSDTEVDFGSFITEKEKSVWEEQKASLLESKTDIVDKLLPVYVTNASEEWITDFEFINYVESMLYSFNLISRESIWVGEIKRVEDVAIGKNNLDSNIFYIPLKLDITGTKSDILDFIHYFENVWSIDIREGQTKVYTDEVISKGIVWNLANQSDNIYRNQLSDIERISIDTYIDSSSNVSRWSLVDFIKTTQERQRFSVDLDVRFYVQWLPDYKIESYIQSVIRSHWILLAESQESLKLTFNNVWNESSSSLKAKNAIRSAVNVLTLMQDDMKKLKVDLWRKDKDLTLLYSDAEEYKGKLEKIEIVMQESASVLNSKK